MCAFARLRRLHRRIPCVLQGLLLRSSQPGVTFVRQAFHLHHRMSQHTLYVMLLAGHCICMIPVIEQRLSDCVIRQAGVRQVGLCP